MNPRPRPLTAFLILDRRPHRETPTPLLRDVCRALADRAIEVEWGVVEEMALRADTLSPEYDLYLLKSYTDLALSLAATLDAQGARILNPYRACAMARDKVVASRRLAAAGIRTPRTWMTANLALLAPRLADGPLIVKPLRGVHGAGVRVVHRPEQLSSSPTPEPVVVQELVPGSGRDLKLYVAGVQVFGVHKAFSPTSFQESGEPCEVSAEAREIALRCGESFGLGLYGLDLVEGPDGPVVVDVNYFPGYRGVPDPIGAVAGYVEDYARKAG